MNVGSVSPTIDIRRMIHASASPGRPGQNGAGAEAQTEHSFECDSDSVVFCPSPSQSTCVYLTPSLMVRPSGSATGATNDGFDAARAPPALPVAQETAMGNTRREL